MKFIRKEGILFFSYCQAKNVIAGCTTRVGYVCDANSLLENASDTRQCINANREKYISKIGSKMPYSYLHQTHSNKIYCVDNEDFKNGMEGDGLYTRYKNKMLCVTIADCGSVVFFDTKASIAAVVHCGWRGLHLNIIGNMVEILSEFVPVENLIAVIGPHIHQNSYQVGAEFLDYFPKESLIPHNNSFLFSQTYNIYEQLHKSRIRTMYNSEMNTASMKHTFFSHRRNGEKGRMFVYVGLI